MTTNPPVVVGVDGSDTSNAAVVWAARTAAGHGAPLRLVAAQAPPVIPGGMLVTSQTFFDDLDAESRRVLTAANDLAEKSAPGVVVETALHKSPPVPLLLDLSERSRMIVLGTRGRGAIRSALLGSVTSAVVTHAHCPVVVVPSPELPAVDAPVVVGVDGSTNSVPAVEAAFVEASLRRAPLVAVHAWSDIDFDTLPVAVEALPWSAVAESEEAALAESLAGMQERFPDVEVTRVVVQDNAVDQLLARSTNAQLVVVGSHGRGGFRGMLLGSTSRALLHRTERPLMVVRQP
ncbi:universal stress protein [Rhodococcus gannanensis]|uniref:Universal stress protein n=1 Tax=Rhodococcus gannanensis TaxID=1960308 RepID=A0ABW4P073_9NOCA